MSPRFFDTHCHLQDERFETDRGEVLVRARLAGVQRMVCCGCRESDWDAVRTLASREEGLVSMLGLHPWYVAGARSGWLSRLEVALIESGAGLGECGLDFALEAFDREVQIQAFREQVRLAKRLERPLSIHCRKAWEVLGEVAQDCGLPEAGAVIHAYSGSAELVPRLQELGFSFGFGCSLANPGNRRGIKAVRAVAADRLLLETDAPDLSPRQVPGYEDVVRNEPAHIGLVLRAAATARGETEAEVAERVWDNACRIFGHLPIF